MPETTTKLTRTTASGVCRTLDSWCGADRMLVCANYGLSEWLADGTVAPDIHILDCETMQPLMEILGSKTTQLVLRGSGVVEIGVPEEERKRFCLSPSQVREIAKLAKAVEVRRGKPVEVEWAHERDALHLLAERHPD